MGFSIHIVRMNWNQGSHILVKKSKANLVIFLSNMILNTHENKVQ